MLDTWLSMAEGSDVDMLKRFASTLRAHQAGFLNYYDVPITTAPPKGTNTKIRGIQRRAYDFRDMAYLKLRTYALHESNI